MAESFVLNTGVRIPSVGLGLWQIQPDAVGNAIYAAYKAGYRHIDCAAAYRNEKEVGLALKKLFEDGVVKREDMFITSKLWSAYHAPEDVPEAIDGTLQNLQLDYLDLYLIHLPMRIKKGATMSPQNLIPTDIPATWGAMEKLYDTGKARAIGVSNFSCKKLEDLFAVARVPPALKKLFEDGVVKREDMFITSKLWSAYHAPEDVPEAIDGTLQNLQLDYLDLYLIHLPMRIKKGATMSPQNLIPTDIPATWGAMEKLYDTGKARAIGVSNFSCKKLEDLFAVARVPPAVNQVECHPVWQQDKLRKLCQSKGVHLSAFSPLGSPGSPGVNGPSVLSNPIVVSVAEKLQKTPAQVALHWGIHMGHSVLPKSTNEARIQENIDIFDWSVPEDLMAKFSEIKQVRLLRAEFAVHPNSGYSTLEDLWDGEI